MAMATKKPKPAKETALRDEFAMAVMVELIADRVRSKNSWTNSTKHYIASDAYAIADAMLAERRKKGGR